MNHDAADIEAESSGGNIASSISVFFPCYNEQENVKHTVEKAVRMLDQLGIDYEIIIVNDGSRDDTGKIADDLAAENNRIKVVNHKQNLGYGAALQSGFRAATKKLVFYTDGDGQFDIGELPPLLALMEQFDIVSCFRTNRRDNLIRKINAWCWTKLVCFLFGMNIRDIDCAFKLYKKKIFDNITLKSTGALIDAEILARAISMGYTVTQRPVRHYPRTAGAQTGAKLKVILRAFRELFELRREILKDKVQ